ncbi:MAG: YjbE family putative metal transport protein, partial [Burkholderiaceae bacterium]
MGFDSAFQYLNLTLEVFFLDLLLSGDNAVVIALACRSLQVGQRRQAMLIGAGLGIALRILLTSIAGLVLRIPALKLLGGIALTAIAVQLTLDDPEPAPSSKAAGARAGSGRAEILSAIGTVVVADLVMSTDNVIALAAVAKGSVAVLALGLLFSVPLLMFGSWYVTGLLQRYPLLTQCGGALLGWLAGDIAVSDPLYAGWVAHQSPALGLVVPALGAVYVLLQSRIIQQARIGAAALRPVRRITLAAAKTVPSSHARPQPPARAATAPLPVSIGVVDPPLAFERPAAIALDAAAPLSPERTSPRAKRLPRMVVLGGAGAV